MHSLTRLTRLLVFIITIGFLSACAGGGRVADTSISAFNGQEPNVRVKVSGRRGRGRIVDIPMETYLAGVIGHEMSIRWPVEALKAQTVAARSYALHRMQVKRAKGSAYDVLDSQADQVFRLGTTKNDYLLGVVTQTRGQVLVKNNQIISAYYSSTCGGKTETASGAGLSKDSPLNRCGSDTFCEASPFRNWYIVTTLKDLEKKMRRKGVSVRGLSEIKIESRNPSGYVKTVSYKDANGWHHITGKDFRQTMGSMTLKSLLFDLTRTPEGSITISGHGFGHGVGLCQYGAKEMALKGYGYRRILTKYYPKIMIRKAY